MFNTPVIYLDSEYSYHRERATTDFRNAAYRREYRARRRARKQAAARRLVSTRQPADVR
jgi:hypothetical protein